MGAAKRSMPAQMPAAAPPQVLVNGGMDPAGTPDSGYDALAESRKRIAAAANRRSLFAQPGLGAPVLGTG